MLPHSLPIRTPEAQGTTPHPSSDRSAEGPGPSTEPQSLLRPKPDFHTWKLRPRETEKPAGVTRGGGSSGTRRRACGRCALPGTATGASWEEARAVSQSSLSVEASPRPLTAEVTTAPQAGAAAPAPTPERSPGAPARPCREGGGGVRRDGHTHRDPETLEGVGPRWGPQEGETWSHSRKVSGRGKLLWAGSLALWGPASPRAHTPSRGKGGPGSRPPGPFRREGTKQKVEESGGPTRGPSFAHLAPQRHGGSGSESARRGSRHCRRLHGILAPWPHPLLRPRPAPPKPRPPESRELARQAPARPHRWKQGAAQV